MEVFAIVVFFISGILTTYSGIKHRKEWFSKEESPPGMSFSCLIIGVSFTILSFLVFLQKLGIIWQH